MTTHYEEECLKIDKSRSSKETCLLFRNSFECLKTHCAANNWPSWTQNFYKVFFKNILLYIHGRLSKICSVRMLYPGRFFFIESVDHSWRNLYLIHSCPTSTSRIFITRTRFRAWSPLIVVNTTPRLTMICHGTPLILSSFHSSLNCHIFEHICVKRLILACFGALWKNVPLRYSKICLFIIDHLSQIWPLLSNIYCPKSSAKIH